MIRRKSTKRNRELREFHVKKQKNKCYYCNKRFGTTPKDLPTLEHIIPLGLGGYDKQDNICASCWECNDGRNRHRNPRLGSGYAN